MRRKDGTFYGIELKLLVLFEELFRTHNLTRASRNIGQAQPTVSAWLARLRQIFGDPLFVRTAEGMTPTEYAKQLHEPIHSALETLRCAALGKARFDPETSKRTFRICMTDSSHIVLLPSLLAYLQRVSKGIAVTVLPISISTIPMLEAGEVDLAVGYLSTCQPGTFQQTLFVESWVCLVSRGHPRIQAALSVEQFAAERHVAVDAFGTEYVDLDRLLAARRVVRRIALRLPGFLGLAKVLATTELIATVPRRIAGALADSGPLQILGCPVAIPTYKVRQYWHALQHHDLGGRWLRKVTFSLFSQPASSADVGLRSR